MAMACPLNGEFLMTRLVIEQLQVTSRNDGQPAGFNRHGWHTVTEIVDHWRELGAWWEGEGPRDVWHIITDKGLECELHYLKALQQWVLYRIYD